MAWDAFRDTHYRPNLVVMLLPVGLEPADGLLACERIVRMLEPAGDYALRCERQSIRVAFEIPRDAMQFGKAARAKQIKPEPEWAVTLVGRLAHVGKGRARQLVSRRRFDA